MKEVSDALRALGGNDGLMKERVGRAAHLSGLSFTRAKDIWYGDARKIEDHERLAILSALVERKIADERNELHELKLAQLRMESRLNQMEAALRRAASHDDIRSVAAAFNIPA